MNREEKRAKMIARRKECITKGLTGRDIINFIQKYHLENIALDTDDDSNFQLWFIEYDNIDDYASNITEYWMNSDGTYCVERIICEPDGDILDENIMTIEEGNIK